MTNLLALNRLFLRIPRWRRHHRRLTRALKSSIGVPDAYGDLFAVVRRTGASAVLDIGAFVGETVERFTDELDVPVYAFEPTPRSFEVLRARFAGRRNVHLFDLALSDRAGEAALHCNANPQTNSLLPADERGAGSFAEHTESREVATVRTQTLDAWAAEHLPSGRLVIKADVQGAEGRLLDGGRESFSLRVVAIYSEAHLSPIYRGQISFTELHERLTGEFGFVLHNVYPCMQDAAGRAVQLDALWIKEEALAAPERSRSPVRRRAADPARS